MLVNSLSTVDDVFRNCYIHPMVNGAYTVFKRTSYSKTECKSTLNNQRRTLSTDGFVWQCSGRKVAMDKHQSARTQLNENDSYGNVIKNFGSVFNLSAESDA